LGYRLLLLLAMSGPQSTSIGKSPVMRRRSFRLIKSAKLEFAVNDRQSALTVSSMGRMVRAL
jgi:hypothetical protein